MRLTNYIEQTKSYFRHTNYYIWRLRDNFSATCARTVILSAPPETANVIILNSNFFIPFIQGDTFLPTIDIESTRVFYYSAVLVDNYIVSLLK